MSIDYNKCQNDLEFQQFIIAEKENYAIIIQETRCQEYKEFHAKQCKERIDWFTNDWNENEKKREQNKKRKARELREREENERKNYREECAERAREEKRKRAEFRDKLYNVEDIEEYLLQIVLDEPTRRSDVENLLTPEEKLFFLTCCYYFDYGFDQYYVDNYKYQFPGMSEGFTPPDSWPEYAQRAFRAGEHSAYECG